MYMKKTNNNNNPKVWFKQQISGAKNSPHLSVISCFPKSSEIINHITTLYDIRIVYGRSQRVPTTDG